MNPDRHVYIVTAILAVVVVTFINVLTPRGAPAGTTMHREESAASRASQGIVGSATRDADRARPEARRPEG